MGWSGSHAPRNVLEFVVGCFDDDQYRRPGAMPGISSVKRKIPASPRAPPWIRRGLKDAGLDDPFPWRTLWDWYGYWSANLGSYAARRAYIGEVSGPMIDELEDRAEATRVSDLGANETTWPSIETKIREMIEELDGAGSVDDLQDVGRRCREITIAAANQSPLGRVSWPPPPRFSCDPQRPPPWRESGKPWRESGIG